MTKKKEDRVIGVRFYDASVLRMRRKYKKYNESRGTYNWTNGECGLDHHGNKCVNYEWELLQCCIRVPL